MTPVASADRRAAPQTRWWVGLLLAGLCLAQLSVNAAWLRHGPVDLHSVPDEAPHARGQHSLVTQLGLGGLAALPGQLRQLNSYYPLAAHLLRAPVGLWVSPSPASLRIANGLYLILLLLAVYELGRRCLSPGAGILAAVLVSLMPATVGGSRTLGLDFPALCLTPVAMVFLLRSDGLRRRREALLFGLTAGWACLVKGQVALFLVWPAALELGLGLHRHRARADRWRLLQGALLALGSVLVVTAVWWFGRVGHLLQTMAGHATGEGMLYFQGDTTVRGGLVHYFLELPRLASGPLAVAFLLLVPRSLRRGRHGWTLMAWILVPLLLMVLLRVRHVRYLFPLAPAVALVLAVGLWSLPRWLRWALAPALAGAAATLSLLASFTPVHAEPPGGCSAPESALTYLTNAGACHYLQLAGPPYQDRSYVQPALAPARRLARAIARTHPRGRDVVLLARNGGDADAELVQVEENLRQLLPELWTLAPEIVGPPARPPRPPKSLFLLADRLAPAPGGPPLLQVRVPPPAGLDQVRDSPALIRLFGPPSAPAAPPALANPR